MKPSKPKDGRTRVSKPLSLTPLQYQATLEELERRQKTDKGCSWAEVVQFAIEATYMKSPASPEGRAAAYIEARDRALEFEEDCASLLVAAGFTVERGAKVNGDGHRVDLLVRLGRKSLIIELKSSGRRDRLELVLGQAMLLKSHTRLPLVVCVPYIVDKGIADAFAMAKVGLTSPALLVEVVKNTIG